MSSSSEAWTQPRHGSALYKCSGGKINSRLVIYLLSTHLAVVYMHCCEADALDVAYFNPVETSGFQGLRVPSPLSRVIQNLEVKWL